MSEKAPFSGDGAEAQRLQQDERLLFLALKRAADRGNGAAAYRVAIMLLNGVGCTADPVLSVCYAQQAADDGYAEGYVLCAVLTLRDTLLSDSCAEAVELLQKAVALGSVPAYLLLGQMYAQGVGVPKDAEKGLEYTCLAAGMGSPIADSLLMQGTDVGGWPQDPALRRQLLGNLARFLSAEETGSAPGAGKKAPGDGVMEPAAGQAVGESSAPTTESSAPTTEVRSPEAPVAGSSAVPDVRALGQFISRFLVASPQRDFVTAATALLGDCEGQEREESLAKLQEAATAGVPGASTFLAVLSQEGRGVTDDERQIARYIRADAERGWPQAQYLYSKMLDAGQGCRRAPAQAFAYCQRAAAAGYADACFALGQMYRLGHNTDADPEQAVRYLRQAANFGHPSAMYVLAFMYFRGEGVDSSVERCVALLQRAAELGHVESMYSLAEFAKGDLGYPADTEVALTWLQKAAAAGHQRAQADLDSLLGDLD